MKHQCHASGCSRVIHPKFLMCRSCWSKVPPDLKLQVYRTYTPGQEISKTPSPEYLEAAKRAINSLK